MFQQNYQYLDVVRYGKEDPDYLLLLEGVFDRHALIGKKNRTDQQAVQGGGLRRQLTFNDSLVNVQTGKGGMSDTFTNLN